MSQPAPDPAGRGWRMSADASTTARDPTDLEADVRRTTAYGEFALGVSRYDHETVARAYGSGALVWMGGRPRATSQLGQSFALVETGEPNVVITLENRVIGRTGANSSVTQPVFFPGTWAATLCRRPTWSACSATGSAARSMAASLRNRRWRRVPIRTGRPSSSPTEQAAKTRRRALLFLKPSPPTISGPAHEASTKVIGGLSAPRGSLAGKDRSRKSRRRQTFASATV